MSGLSRVRVGQRGPGAEVSEPSGGPRGQDAGGETQGRSSRGGGQLLGNPGQTMASLRRGCGQARAGQGYIQ